MEDEFEVVDGEAEEVGDIEAQRDPGGDSEELPVIAEVRPLERHPAPGVPAVQVAAVAATGFVAGAAAAALVRRRGTRKLGRARSGPRRSSDEGLPVISTHTYLVRVQLLGRPTE